MFKGHIKNLLFYIGSTPIGKVIARPVRGKGAILCYHRIVDNETFIKEKSPQKNLLTTIENFNNHLSYLSSNYKVVSMDEIVNHLNTDSNEFKIAITFDDGYKDNYEHALPLLEKYKTPATIYIATRFPEGDCTMWWYELWDIINKKQFISFEFREKIYSLDCKDIKQKTNTYNKLSRLIVFEDLNTQKNLLKLIGNKSKLINYSSKCLTWEEIKILSKSSLISIGSHTHNHNSLKHLTDKESFWEIESSKKMIEDVINQAVVHLAYPYGTKNDVSLREQVYSRNCGYVSAVETGRMKLNNNTSVFSLPRVSIRNTRSFIVEGQLSGIGNYF